MSSEGCRQYRVFINSLKMKQSKYINISLFKTLLIALCPLASTPVFSQTQNCKATLCGVVTDAETQQPIPFAEIFIQETGRGEITDDKGKFHFHDLCEGTYTVSCNHIGCDHLAKEVLVKANAEVNFQLKHVALELGEIVVREAFVAPSPAQAQRELFGNSLNAAGRTLGDALQQLPGVTSLNTGSTLSKPVIRGLHSNRVLMLNNGVRQEGQQWGQEHAPEIDPLTAGRVTVVMGANSVRYGAEALGGVILVEPEHLRLQKGAGGEVTLGGFSNGRSGFASARLDGKTGGKLPIAGRLQGSLKRSGNLRAPDYFLENTGVMERNFSATAGLQQRRFSAEVFYNYFSSEIGIFEGSHIETPEDLLEAIERGRPEEDGSFSYDLLAPNQNVAHHTLKTKGSYRTGESGKLIFQYARLFNRRQEFGEDELGHGGGEEEHPETQLDLTTHTADLAWEHKPWHYLQGSFGVQYMRQVSVTRFGDLLPDFDSHTAGIFWTEHWRKRPFPLEFEAGIRYDVRRLYIEGGEDGLIDNTVVFNNLSGTLGTIYRLPKYLKLLLHFGSAWRAPSANELYSEGVHHGSASFELGRDDLKAERAYSANFTLYFNSRKDEHELSGFRVNLSLYRNFIDNFIYLQPQPDPVVTDEGTFPACHYEQTQARLQGLDWSAEWMPTSHLALTTGGSVLRSLNRNNDKPLALMPADRFRHSATVFLGKNEAEDRSFLRLTMVNVRRQNNLPIGVNFARAPAAYTLFNFDATTTFLLGKQPLQTGLAVQNILNAKYREYLNRFRYFADEPGRNLALWLKMSF